MDSPEPKRTYPARLAAVLLAFVLNLPGAAFRAQDLADLDETGDADDLDASLAAEWWDTDWKLRRFVRIEGAGLLVPQEGAIFFQEPDPLLLYNTGRCQKRLVDLRMVVPGGEAVPSGVINFGQDDGTSCLWCKPGPALTGTKLELYLYYGNPRAKPTGDRLSDDVKPPEKPLVRVDFGPEEACEGRRLPRPPIGRFFEKLVVVEAEASHDAQGRKVLFNRKLSSPDLWMITRERACAGAYLAPFKPWHPRPLEQPIEAWTEARIPEDGTWYVHVRYKVTEYRYYESTRYYKPTVQFVPFALILGRRELRCGVQQKPGAWYRWDRFVVEIPAGDLKVGFRMAGCSAPDCVLFTKDERYLPDCRDVSGPVWMRFRALAGTTDPFCTELFCVTRPWSSHGPSGEPAGYLFRDHVIPTMVDASAQARDLEKLLRIDEWSPWVRAFHSTVPTWWSHVRFHPARRGILREGMPGIKVTFQFASRPTGDRVFRDGVEDTGAVPGLFIIMPTRLDCATMLADTLSFAQWARRRFRMVQALGLKPGQGPKEILVSTMATAKSTEETEYIIKTCGLLGFNGLELRTPMAHEERWALADAHGLRSTAQHHWYPKNPHEFYDRFLKRPAEGANCEEAAQKIFAELAEACYSPTGRRWRKDSPRVELVIMGDEIGPAISPAFINALPMIQGMFREYLQRQNLEPGFFGKQNWEEVAAFEDAPLSVESKSYRLLVSLDPTKAREEESEEPQSVNEEPRDDVEEDKEFAQLVDMQREEERAAKELTEEVDVTKLSPTDKRLRYWTTRFRSYYTSQFFGACGREIRKLTAQGHFRRKPFASPNFQAMPVQRSQMWSGALNLFEWARSGTTDFLMLEDWNWDPYRIAFGAEIVRAAARKRGQGIGALLVGGGIRQRFLADLGNGARSIFSYLYGPLRVIGPPWAEHRETNEAWAELLRWVAKCEDDLLAAKNRPAEAAILVANTSEINTALINTAFLRYPLYQRAALYAALKDASMPVEVVGEEEVVEDGALGRYKVLYVGDPHVSVRAQERIKAWVAGGGVLWSAYNGLARQEYDEASHVFDEVFGLAHRPPIEPSLLQWEPEEAEEIIVPKSDLLPAVRFAGVPLKPKYRLSTGKALAHFSDGSPAFIHNRFGKGQAFLLGGTVHPCTSGYGKCTEEPPDGMQKRELVAVAARVAGVRPHVRLSRPRILSFVHDGPQQTVLILVNCFEHEQNGVEVDLFLPRPPAAAFTGRADSLDYKWLGDRARFSADLKFRDGEIIVFRAE